MTEILVIREHLSKMYSAHSKLIDALGRGLLMLVAMVALDSYIGYLSGILEISVIVICSVLAAFLTPAVSAGIICAYALLDLAGVSIEIAGVFAVMALLFLLMYFVFKPGNSLVFTLSIMLGVLQFMGPVPVIVGLILTPMAVFPMTFGILSSRLILYVADNAVVLSGKTSSLNSVQKIMQVVNGVFLNEENVAILVTLVFVAILIYVIRRMPVKYAWSVALGIGAFMYLLTTIICDYALNITVNVPVTAVNVILAVIVGVLLIVMFHMVDYSREEDVQFEDEDYYYFVKAVPKMNVSAPDVKVTRIRESNVKSVSKPAGTVVFADAESAGDLEEAETEPAGMKALPLDDGEDR